MAESAGTARSKVSDAMTRLAATGATFAGATGVALGIGVLAIASRDAMFGLGASASTYTTSTRVGYWLFLDSFAALAETRGDAPFHVIAVASFLVLMMIGTLVMFERWPEQRLPQWSTIFIATHAAAVVAALVNAQRMLAVLHPYNRDFIHTEPSGAPPPQLDSFILRVHDALKLHVKGLAQLHGIYAELVLPLTILTVCALVSRRWIPGLRREVAVQLPMRLLSATLLALMAFEWILVPSIYGALILSTNTPCVELTLGKQADDRWQQWVKDESEQKKAEDLVIQGYLLSGPAADAGEFQVIRLLRRYNRPFVHVYQRSEVIGLSSASDCRPLFSEVTP
jgi:hypothetical protein